MKKVMVIDDQYTIRELVGMTMEESYEVIKVEDATTAFKRAKEEMPDLIILDIMMPKIDGYQICRMLKWDEKTKKIPVIILTAKHLAEDAAKAKEMGANYFMTKPFEPSVLKKKVDEFIS